MTERGPGAHDERSRRGHMVPDRRFTLHGATRHHADVERWFEGRSGELQQVARRWFDEIRAAGPDVLELLHDGQPTACVGDVAFAYVNAFRAHVNVGFFGGAALHDPARLLQGTGKFMRHVKLGPTRAVEEDALRRLILVAYESAKAPPVGGPDRPGSAVRVGTRRSGSSPALSPTE